MTDAPESPPFTLPRASLRRLAETAAAYGLDVLPALVAPRVLDVGAGVGVFAALAAEVWPGARITCYEEDSRAFAELERNVDRLAVECRNHPIRDASSQLFPCDVLKVDARGAEVPIVARYEHLASVRVLLVVTRDPWRVYDLARIASAAGLAPAGRHVDAEGATTLRFTREVAADAKAREAPPEHASAEPDRPVTAASRSLHLFVALLTGGGQVWVDVETCIHELRALCRESGVALTVVRESTTGVDRARNRQSERFLDMVRSGQPGERPTHILQLDDDIVFDPADVLKLMRSDMDVTAIVYPRKEIDWERVARAVKAGADAAHLAKYESPFVLNFVNGQGVRHPEIGSLLEVEEVGTGCLMIKAEALERYVAAYREELEYVTDYAPRGVMHHQIFHCERDPVSPREMALRETKAAALALRRAEQRGAPTEAECAALFRAARAWSELAENPQSVGRYLTEDYSFCRRWRMLGGKIHVLLEGELGHVGTYVYHGSLATAVRLDQGDPSSATTSGEARP